MKKTTTQLFHSLIALLLCVSMLMGSTFAWFTDSATSTGNVITTGSLNAELFYSDTYLTADEAGWKSAENTPIFTHENWEPGYTDVKYVKITNAGDLAFRWKLSIESEDEMSNLADVIDVYYVNPAKIALESLDGLTGVGTLTEVVNNRTSTSGALLPKGESKDGEESGDIVLAIAMKMREDAGNEYQNQSAGTFSIKLLTTQYSYESDSFDNGYDTEAVFPNINLDGSVSVSVVPDENGNVPTGGVTMTNEEKGISAYVPEGVSLKENTNRLVLTVKEVEESQANIVLSETEVSLSVDVHIDGISQENQTPILVTIKKLLAPGLNIGNYQLYHVENDTTVAMTCVSDAQALDTHNAFIYDPATGDVTMALCSFSEIALVSDTVSAWEGSVATSFAGGDGSETTPYLIANADQLAYFSQAVSRENDTYGSACYKLIADVNLNGNKAQAEDNKSLIFYPVGYWALGEGTNAAAETVWYTYGGSFKGTFDGNGNTIENIYQNTWLMDGDYDNGYWDAAMGIFGYVNGGTVKNLTVKNFSSDGEFTPTGVIAAYAAGNAAFENIAIFDCNPRVYNTGNGGIIGVGGDTESANTPDNTITLKNITVDQSNKISALWGSWDVACGGLMGMFRGYSKVAFDNCHVAAQIDVNNDVCANYQYYWYRYSGMFIGSVRRNTTDADGYTVAYTDGIITAENCTYTYGDWNEYWYCELVANSIASYTHDYQFSRLTKISALTEIQDDNGAWDTEGNFVLPSEDNTSATCYHIFKDSDGNLYEHKHGVADASNPSVYEDFDLNGDGELNDLKEDRTCYYIPFGQLFTGSGWGVKACYEFSGMEEKTDGTVKAETKFEAPGTITNYIPGESIKIGDLFESIVDDSKLSKTSIFVAVSPAGENATVSATYAIDLSDWKNGTITFAEDSTGSAKVVITDYYYCTETVIYLGEPSATQKFTANDVSEKDADAQLTLGELFKANSDATLGGITATVTSPDGTTETITATASDWESQIITLSDDGEWTISITDDNYCIPTEVTITVNPVDKFEVAFDHDTETEGKQNYVDTYLYRVGNENAVSLGSLFAEKSGIEAINGVNVTIASINGDAAGAFTADASAWKSGSIQFTGTGIVSVTITADGANAAILKLEVVDAKNVTSASFGGNSVLLRDISVTTTISASGVLYGNGFTINMENAPITEKNGAIFHLYDGTILKNVKIVGKEYTTVSASVNDTNYGVSAVRAWGTVIIENCYISGCRSAVSVTGTELTIKDSVIANGIYANIDFRSGTLNLHNVTTINEPHTVDGTTVLGLGIVGNMTASAGRALNVTGDLTQYNWVSESDCENIKASGVDSIFSSVFTEDQYASLRYTYNGTTYVNTGILSLCNDFGESAVTGVPTDYSGIPVTATINNVTIEGFVWAPAQAGTLSAEDMAYHDTVYEWTPSNQGTSYVAPSFDFSSTDLTVEEGVVQIGYESGSSYTLTAEIIKAILPTTKYGQTLSYKVSMNGTDYTDSDIIFDATNSQTYTITYTITDHLIYDQNGELTSTTYEVTKALKVFATVVDKSADAPTFTFYYGTNGSASAGTPHTTQPTDSYSGSIKQIGETYYIMPDVSAATENAIGSQTVDNETVYYPIVDGINVRSGNATDYDFTRYYPIFKAVKISDNGTEYSYSGTTEMPATVAWKSATIDSGNGASALNADFGLYNNQYLCKIQTKAGDAESGGTSVVEFSYTALDGNTYYYYVGFRFYDENEGSCITPDTLITLADGTQKRIDELTYEDELLAWDFYNGCYVTTTASVIFNHGNGIYKVTNLHFSDGTTARIIAEHEFFDAEANSFICITEENVSDYVGHSFVKADGDGYKTVILESYSFTEEETECYTILTAKYFNALVEGMFSLTPDPTNKCDSFFRPHEVGENMKYDEEKLQASIEKYGLYDYEDFAAYMTYEEFVAFGIGYAKILVGMGYITFEDILNSFSSYAPNH